MIQAVMVGRDAGDLKAANMQRSLLSLLRHYSGFLDAQQDMFEERVHKLMSLENIRKTVENKEIPKLEVSFTFGRLILCYLLST